MSIVTETFDLDDGTQFTFKYDDTVITRDGNYPYNHDALTENFYTAYEVEEINKVIPAGYSPYMNENLSAWNDKPFNPFIWNENTQTWNINKNHYEDLTYFGHVVLIYKKAVPNTTSHTYHLITEIDVSRLVCHYVTSYMENRYTIKTDDNDSLSEYCDILNKNKTDIVGSVGIVPFTVTDDGAYLRPFLTGDVGGRDNTPSANWSEGDLHNYSNYYNDKSQGAVYTMFPETDINLYVRDYNPAYYRRDIDSDYALIFYAGGRSGGGKQCWSYLEFKSENSVLKQLALRGLAFEFNGTRYYPVITNGKVTGYTDNFDGAGDFRDYDGIHTHFVPSNREDVPPSDTGDNIDEMSIDTSELGGASIAGAVTYYTMTNVQLSSFMDALAESTAEHPDIETGFVTASYIPNVLDSVARATDMPIRVKGVTLSAHGNKVLIQHAILLDTINVPRRHNNALDTLTKYFLYTPYTDVIPLNYKCFGRTLSIYLLPSLQDCTASIVVQCDGMTIAKQTVSLGSSLAIALENNAEKTAAIVNACSKYLVSAGGVIGGALTGNVPAVAGGAIGVVASTVNAQNAIGSTYIHSYGTTTGTTLSLNPKNIYIIEYVVQTDKPANFAATVGNLVNKEMELTENMGFTVCENPRITGNMTLLERAEIENYLKSGVIL